MTSPDLTTPAERLGTRIRARRAALRISQADLAQQARLSDATVRRIESGATTGMQAGTRAALEVALKWRDGLIDRILDGTATEAELAEVVARAGTATGTGTAQGVSQNDETRQAAYNVPPSTLADAPDAALTLELLSRLVLRSAPQAPVGRVADAVKALSALLPLLHDEQSEATTER